MAEKEFFLSHYRTLSASLLQLRSHSRSTALALSALHCLVTTYPLFGS